MKSMRILLIILTLLVCSEATSWINKINGVYYGQMWSGGGELGCTTRFSVKKGKITGSYVMMEPLSAEEGTIEKCGIIKTGKIHCKWRDRYGFGDMILKFSQDRKSFSGRWNDEGKHKQKFAWRGKSSGVHIKLAYMAIKTINIDSSLNKIVVYHFNQIGYIYPIVRKNKKVFFDYYNKYLSFDGVKDDLISFCITQFSQKKLQQIIMDRKSNTKEIKELKKAIEFQSIVVGKSKADNHFGDFISIMEEETK